MFKSQLVLFLLLSGEENSSCLPWGRVLHWGSFSQGAGSCLPGAASQAQPSPGSTWGFDSVGDVKVTEVERNLLGMKWVLWAGLESIKGFIYVLS